MLMVNVALLIGIIFLFIVLGFAADIVVKNTRSIAHALGVPLVFLGLIIGLLTTLPELSIGISALANNVPDLTVGNLLGGIVVLFLLILGLSVILARRISTDGNAEHLAPVGLFIILPFFMSIDGRISRVEGVVLMAMYVFLLFLMYEMFVQKQRNHAIIKRQKLAKELFILFIALCAVVVSADLIVSGTMHLLTDYRVSPFIIGLLAFPLGTNLPEIVVSFRSWRRHASSLSWSNLVGSAIANVFVLGSFASIKTLVITRNNGFLFLSISVVIAILCAVAFYRSERAFTRREGFALIALYLVFLVGYSILTRAAA